jgi:hypothetical protein
MSQQPISLSPDLRRLSEEGYALDIRQGYLLVADIPYVNANREIQRGTLICPLELAGDVARPPADHVAKWAGDHPCHFDGSRLTRIEHSSAREKLLSDVFAEHTFSAKPKDTPVETYSDFYVKVTRYVAIISGPAEHLDPQVTSRTHRVIEPSQDEVIFKYADTASSRTHIVAIAEKLKVPRVAIIGVGGTGSYVLDLIAKSPVMEIHLFDKDYFLQHNAFRSPGAPSKAALQKIPSKVEYFRDLYSNMREGIIAHKEYVDESNIEKLREMSFVFVCIDQGEPKVLISAKLTEWRIPFVDVGMGVYKAGDSLGGILRVTSATEAKHDHLERHISFGGGDPNADYSQAIQIADLNALNATLAVIKWKKMCGFYLDLEREHHTTYTIDGNAVINEECLGLN